MPIALAVLAATTILSADVATLRLEAPFDELFAASQGGTTDVVDGRLTQGDGAPPVPVKVSVRGHTSRRETECTFPKLKVELEDGKQLKIGTHCGESLDNKVTPKYGRLPNERSPWREAAVYGILEALGVPALQAKAARITYVYPDGRSIERNAILVEDEDAAVKRLGGAKEIDADEFTTADRLFSRVDAVTLAFAQALVGNFDWCVRFHANDTYRCDAKEKLWNVVGIQMPDGKVRPLMHDFDVSGMVAGTHRWFKTVFNPDFEPDASEHAIEVISQLQRTRSLFTRADLDAARRRFVDKKAGAYQALAQARVDDAGRAVISDYLDAFFSEIETDEHFYRPVIVDGVVARTTADPAGPPICGPRSTLPVGTPVSAPLETRGDAVRVAVLDALWHWGPQQRCPAVKQGTVWVASTAISRDYPKR